MVTWPVDKTKIRVAQEKLGVGRTQGKYAIRRMRGELAVAMKHRAWRFALVAVRVRLLSLSRRQIMTASIRPDEIPP